MSSVEQWQVSLALAAALVGAALVRPSELPDSHMGIPEIQPDAHARLPQPQRPPVPPLALPEVAVPPGLPPIGTPPGVLIDPIGGQAPTPPPLVVHPIAEPVPPLEPFDCPGCGMG
jgi:hypothetical protein